MRMLFILLLGFTSCTAIDQELRYQIDPRLEPHVNKFFEEAEARGMSIPKYNLIAEEDFTIETVGVSRQVGDQRVILIFDWCIENYSHAELELVVFHELGHAILDRRHCEHYSIMMEGISNKAYEGDDEKRRLLVDELFLNK
jgi:Zn-dependent peptidase ImmA (M78 family)